MSLSDLLDGKGVQEVPPDVCTAIIMVTTKCNSPAEAEKMLNEGEFKRLFPLLLNIFRAMIPRL